MTTFAPQAAPEPATYELFVDGAFRAAAAGRTSERFSPADGQLVGRYARGDRTDVDVAVRAARRAFDDGHWATLAAPKRTHVMLRVADLLRQRAESIGLRISLELGKPLAMARDEVSLAAEVFEYYAALALDQRDEAISRHTPIALGLILHEPVGVVAVITPWNYPMMSLVWKVAPALAAGCTIVSKPASLTPGCALELGPLLAEAGVPAGVYNVVTGDGSEAGRALLEHPGVDKIAFTGSTEVGTTVMRTAATTLKRVSLELGGKSPNIVFADADLDQAVRSAYWAIFLNTGQACQAGSRLLVQREIHEEFVAALAERTRHSKVGRPLADSVQIGPLVDEVQLGTVLEYIRKGREAGATVVTGGNRLGGELSDGYFVEPTIFDNVAAEHTIAREEIFGPVLAVTPFDTADDAVALANDNPYGLAAAVWSSNVNTVIGVSKRLRAGTVWVNAYYDAGMPFCMPMGGYKASGFGRELGREGLEEYFETKSVHLRLPKP